MKKNINIRNIIIVMLCITIIFMGVGFVFLASRLETETNNIDNFDVSITKVEALTAVKGGLIEPATTKELVDDGKTIKFNFTLNNPKDELAYEITIKNTGTIPAKVIKIIQSPDYTKEGRFSTLIEPVSITYTDINNKTLLPDETVKVKLLVTYGITNEIKTINIPYQLSVLATSKN